MNDTLLLLSWANPFPALKHHPPINSVFLIWAAEKNTHIIRHCSFKRPLLCLFLLLCSTHSACIKQFGDPPSPLHCAHHIALSQRISPGFHSTHIPNPHRSTAATPESKRVSTRSHPAPFPRPPRPGNWLPNPLDLVSMSPSSDAASDTIMVSDPSPQGQSTRRPGSAEEAAPTGGNSSVPKPKRLACIVCRRRKLKCDGIKPSCSTCARLGHTCAYDEVRKKSGPKRGYVKALEERLST